MTQIAIKRIYEPPSEEDGLRVLVDRVWPRGLSKREAAIDRWFREVAPSTELRKWFGHDPAKWDGFRERYRRELDSRRSALRALLTDCRKPRITLLFSAKDAAKNQAVVLKEVLESLQTSPAGSA